LDSFNDLYNMYYKSVYRLAFRFLNDFENASDISQDVFIHLYNCIIQKKEIRNEKAWLYKVTSNLCLAFIKKNKRINSIKTEATEVQTESDINTEILEALQKLKEKDRMLLTLYNEGLTYKELAEITGIKFTSISKTLSRALKKLKDEIER